MTACKFKVGDVVDILPESKSYAVYYYGGKMKNFMVRQTYYQGGRWLIKVGNYPVSGNETRFKLSKNVEDMSVEDFM